MNWGFCSFCSVNHIARNRGGNYGGGGLGAIASQIDMTWKILIKVRYFLSGKWRKTSESISDMVPIYVKFCNKELKQDMDSSKMNRKTISSVQFSSVQFSSVQFSSVQFSSVQFSSVQFSSVQFSSVQFI